MDWTILVRTCIHNVTNTTAFLEKPHMNRELRVLIFAIWLKASLLVFMMYLVCRLEILNMVKKDFLDHKCISTIRPMHPQPHHKNQDQWNMNVKFCLDDSVIRYYLWPWYKIITNLALQSHHHHHNHILICSISKKNIS